MPEIPEEVPKNRGCKCGWPIDSCHPKFNPNLKGSEECPKQKHEMEVQRFGTKRGLLQKAADAERDAAFYKRAAGLVVVREK